MKKKLLAIVMMITMVFALASCDFLSTIQAAAGFASEYNQYKGVYESATQFTVLTETDLTISESTVVDELIEDMHTSLYLEIDKDSNFLYVEHEGVLAEDGISVFEDAPDNLYIDYRITMNGEDTVVTPTIPEEGEERIDGDFSFNNVLNSSFNPENVDNLLLVEGVYSFDVLLTEAVNVEELDDFVNQYDIFAGDMTAFDDAVAHVEMEFISTDNTIDVSVSVTDYTITFESETETTETVEDPYVTLSLTFDAVITAPDTFEMLDVFDEAHQFVAVDNPALARRVYSAAEVITYPAVAGESGYVQVSLEAGNYYVLFTEPGQATYVVYDAEMNAVLLADDLLTVTEAGTFYLYLTPTADHQLECAVATEESLQPVTTTTAAE